MKGERKSVKVDVGSSGKDGKVDDHLTRRPSSPSSPSSPPPLNPLKRVKELALAVRSHSDICLSYGLYGVTVSFPLTAFRLWVNSESGLNLSDNVKDLLFYYSFIYYSYGLKFMWGRISDRLPLFKERRRPYCVLSSVGVGCMLIAQGVWVTDLQGLYYIGVSLAVFQAVWATVLDGVCIDRAKNDLSKSTEVQCAVRWSLALSSLVAVALSTAVLAIPHFAQQPQHVIVLTSLFAFAGTVASFFIVDIKIEGANEALLPPMGRITVGQRGVNPQLLAAVLKQYGCLAVYLFVRGAIPSSSIPFTSFVYSSLDLPTTVLGGLTFIGPIGSLLAVCVYWCVSDRVRLTPLLLGTTVLSALVGLLQLAVVSLRGVTPTYLIPVLMVIQLLLYIDSRLSFQPIIILITFLSAPRAPATTASILFSLENLGNSVSGFLTAGLSHWLSVGAHDEWRRLPHLVALCESSKLIPLLLVPLINLKVPTSAWLVLPPPGEEAEQSHERSASLLSHSSHPQKAVGSRLGEESVVKSGGRDDLSSIESKVVGGGGEVGEAVRYRYGQVKSPPSSNGGAHPV